MISSARRAQLGLCAVGVVFALSMGVLGSRAAQWQDVESRRAPDFVLPDTDGQLVDLASLRGNVIVLVFSSRECRDSSAYHDRIVRFADDVASSGRVKVVAIDTNLRGAKDADAQSLRLQRNVSGEKFPTLIDSSGSVARLYHVGRTPTVCVISRSGLIHYRGAFDDNIDPQRVHARYCSDAVSGLLADQPRTTAFTQTLGYAQGEPR